MSSSPQATRYDQPGILPPLRWERADYGQYTHKTTMSRKCESCQFRNTDCVVRKGYIAAQWKTRGCDNCRYRNCGCVFSARPVEWTEEFERTGIDYDDFQNMDFNLDEMQFELNSNPAPGTMSSPSTTIDHQSDQSTTTTSSPNSIRQNTRPPLTALEKAIWNAGNSEQQGSRFISVWNSTVRPYYPPSE
ncbi:uncharacterized protein L201_007149 [Kwoniella dendrophila CBS 6074]|uniref:Zn(2)-C6 fungal-type domain-containing protein n=1 Tax=Kwoniella dendrophila CBS 6074 TaxID=1295534 RepID=A0AAX4K5X5_9TREE